MKKNTSKNENSVSISDKQQISKQISFPIVGIGASAGGLEALEQFLGNMPENNGMAFVIIQHLDPNYEGIMPELLQRITRMKVTQASDRLKVAPNHVYVIPPNKSLSILNGALHLFDPLQSHGLRLPIDIFFRSLADDLQDKAIGIILSGMGSDGSLGVKAIKEKNGLVLVQNPSTAKFDGMPKSALDAVVVDISAAADELPGKLISYLKFTPVVKPDSSVDIKNESNLDKIIILLREKTGHDLSLYKKNTLFRRIERRKGVHQIDKINNYVRFLQENPSEIDILFKELLIGVTSFFRDPAVWELLKNKILPDLLVKLPDGHQLRAWIPACSTGEEAYSLAIVFREMLENLYVRKKVTLQIFATDIDNEAIEVARRGYFSKNIATDVSPDRLRQFFTQEDDGYRLNINIREMIVFATQNVIKDPPFTKLDLLSCRNMLIYMEAELQKKIISLFNYSLKPGGLMILGNSESIGAANEGFKELNTKLKIFKRNANGRNTELIDFPSSFYNTKTFNKGVKLPEKAIENIQSLTNELILQKYAPATVLVNKKGDIIYISGRTGKYLEPVAGKANWNIHAMAREGLQSVLPGAFRKALENNFPVIIKNIKIGTNGGTQFINILVQRIEKPDALNGMVIVVFIDVDELIQTEAVGKKSSQGITSKRMKELEMELQRSYEELQSTREEMQTSQEELKSTNEELQSTNEELQSTNEELTTSKEEMQSLNEELQTVNIELQSKVNDFVRANDDMKNLLNSTEIATLFLDKGLNIRRFTEMVTKIFKIRHSDIGRPFTDLVNDLQYPDIELHAREVIKTLTSKETSINTSDGRWFDIRIMPYRTLDDHIDGLVITFTNTTKAKNLEFELKKANEILRTKNKK
ncbi:MAG: PAS domain-containing protein [Bacteroidales bacterium]|nr:PAS domain-containing protein [Bacteroidales bacterium]